MNPQPLGWFGIFRLGLVQAAIGAIVVITTSTLNRVLVVELALPAMIPGALVALHYFVQILRPRLGYSSDIGGRRTPWIIGGMGVLGLGAVLASLATAMMATQFWPGLALAVVAFLVIGGGVGACGTALLVLLSKSVAQTRLAAAATVTWVMMIMGFIVTTILAAKMLEPFSLTRLVEMTAVVAAAAFLVTVIATRGLESPAARKVAGAAALRRDDTGFREALRAVWRESHSRRLTSFVFISMLAYSAQDLVLEPFAGAVFGLSPAESTRLSGLMSSGTLLGMILVALVCTVGAKAKVGRLRLWTIGGCIASASMLLTLAVSGFVGPAWPLRPTVFLLGLANGAYAVAAIGTMMGLVGRGRERREGTRMGLWGAAQSMAFAVGGLAATGLVDFSRWAFESVPLAYAVVFAGEAALFVWATVFAVRLSRDDTAGLVEVDLQERSALYVTEAGRG